MSMGASGTGFTDAGILYIRKGFESPPICILSGEPVDHSTKQCNTSISYSHPLGFIAFIIPPFGLLSLLFFHKAIRIPVYLSEKHARKLKRNKFISWITFFISLLCILGTFLLDQPLLFVAGIISFGCCVLWTLFTNKILKVSRHENKFFQVTNAHPNFLSHIQPTLLPLDHKKFKAHQTSTSSKNTCPLKK